MENNERDHAAELAAVQATRASLADRLVTPWWYHPTMGLLLAAICVNLGVGSKRTAPLSLLCIFGLLWLGDRYRRTTGIDLTNTGKSKAPTSKEARSILYPLVAFIAVLLLASALVPRELDWPWLPWVAAGVLFVASIALGRAYDSALRTDLRTKAL